MGCRPCDVVVAFCLFSLILAGSPVAPETVEFERAIWQTPVITELGDSTRIEVGGQPAGLLLRAEVSAVRRYRLVVEGRGGPMTMRLKFDDGPYQYVSAPIGRFSRVVAGPRNIELLFYADAPTSYELSSARLEPCLRCKTADDLKARILAELPELDDMAPIERIRALLRWSSNVTDYTDNRSLLPRDFEAWEDFDALFEFFDKDIGGVVCGGMSVFTNRIFHRFGIDAFTINYGIPGSMITHVSVVVPFEGRFLLADPTFGLIFEHNGRPLDIAEGLRLIRAGRQNEIRPIELGLEDRDIISPLPEWQQVGHIICPAAQILPSGVEGCKLGARSFRHIFDPIHGAEWTRAGIPVDDWVLLKLMYKGVFSVGDGLNGSENAPSHGTGRRRFP